MARNQEKNQLELQMRFTSVGMANALEAVSNRFRMVYRVDVFYRTCLNFSIHENIFLNPTQR